MKIRSTDIALDGAANGSVLQIGPDGIPVWGAAPAGSGGGTPITATTDQMAFLDVSTVNSFSYGTSFAKMTLDTVNYDSASGWDATNHQYTIPSTGYYLVVGKYRIADNTSSVSQGIGVGPSAVDNADFRWSQTEGMRQGHITTIIKHYTAGDVIFLYCYVDGSVNITSASLQVKRLPTALVSSVSGTSGGGGGGASSLSELTDVDLTTPPTDGQALVWSADENKFVPGSVAAGDGGGSAATAAYHGVKAVTDPAGITIPGGTTTKVPFTVTKYDTGSIHSAGDNARFYPDKVGPWLFTANATAANNGASDGVFLLRKNGEDDAHNIASGYRSFGASSNDARIITTDIVALGDWYEVGYYSNSDTTGMSAEFSAHYIGDVKISSGSLEAPTAQYIFVKDHDVTGKSAITLALDTSKYRSIKLVFEDVAPSINYIPTMLVSQDGGTTFASSGYQWSNNLTCVTNYFSSTGSTSDSSFHIAVGASANDGIVGEIELLNINTTGHFRFHGEFTTLNTDGNVFTTRSGGNFTTAGSINAIQFPAPSGGTFTAGKIRVYGELINASENGGLATPITPLAGLLRLAKTSDQPIANGSWQRVQWQNELEDTLNTFDSTVDNTVWTVPANVQRMRISASIAWQNNGGDRYIAIVRVSDGHVIVADIRTAPNEAAGNLATVWFDVIPGEQYFLQVNTGTGSSTVTGPGGFIYTGAEMQVEWATKYGILIGNATAGKHVIAYKGPTDAVTMGQSNAAAQGVNLMIPDMMGVITLANDCSIEISFNVSNSRTSGKCRYHIYIDNELIPTGGTDSPGAPAWYDTIGNDTTTNSFVRGFFNGSFVVEVTAGTHTIDIRYNDALSASTTNFYTRSLLYEIVDGSATLQGSGGGDGASELSALTDVDFTVAPTDGQSLVYDATSHKWAPETITSGAPALSGLTDVSPTAPTSGQALVYDSVAQKWTPNTLPIDTANYRVAPYTFIDNPLDFPIDGLSWSDEFQGPNIDARWTWVNQTTNGITMNGYIKDEVLNFTPTAPQSGWNFAGLVRDKPAGNFDIVAKVGLDGFPTNYNAIGLCAFNSTTGVFNNTGFHARGDGSYYTSFNRWNNFNSLNTDNSYHTGKPYGYLRLTLVGTTFTSYFSEFGRHWEVMGTEDVADFVGAGWDKIMLATKSESTAHKVHSVVHWIRNYGTAGPIAGSPTSGSRAIVETSNEDVFIRQRAFGRVSGGNVTLALPYPPKVGNMLVGIATGFNSAKTIGGSNWSTVVPSTSSRNNQMTSIVMKFSDGSEQQIVCNSVSDYGNFAIYELENAGAIRGYALAPDVNSGTFTTSISDAGLKLFGAEIDTSGVWSSTSQFLDFVPTLSLNNNVGNHSGFFGVLPAGFVGPLSATVTNELNTVLCYAAIDGRPKVNVAIERGNGYSAHRYWRIIGETNANRYMYISELVFAETVGGAQLATGGTALSIGDYSGGPKENAFDGNTGTYWEGPSGAAPQLANYLWLGYDFGHPVKVGEVRISTDMGYNFPDERINTGRVQYSDDGANWVTAWAFNTFGWNGSGVLTKSFSNNSVLTTTTLSTRAKARYWRVRVSRFIGGQSGWGAVAMAYRDGAGNILSTGGTAISSQPFSPGSPNATPPIVWTTAAAFNTDTTQGNGWYSGSDAEMGANGAANSWLGYDFGSPVAPYSVEWAPLTTYNWTMPHAVSIEYSYDGVSWLPHTTTEMAAGADTVVQKRLITDLPRQTVVGNLPEMAGNAGKVLAVSKYETKAEWIAPPFFGRGLYDIGVGVPRLSNTTQSGTPGSYTYTENPGLGLNVKNTAGTGKNELAGFIVPVTSMVGSWAVLMLGNFDNRQYVGQGIGFHNSTTGAFKTLTDLATAQFSFATWSAYDNRTGQSEPGYGLDDRQGAIWWHADCDGTTMRFGISRDGANPIWEFSEAVSANLGSFDGVWFGIFNSNNNPQVGCSASILCFDGAAASRVMGVPQATNVPQSVNVSDFPVVSLNVTIEVLDSTTLGFTMPGSTGGQQPFGYAVGYVSSSRPYSYARKVSLDNTYTNYQGGGLMIRNSTTGLGVALELSYNSSSGGLTIQVNRVAADSASQTNIVAAVVLYPPSYQRIRDDGTNLFFEYSYTGKKWHTLYTAGSTADIGAYDQIGVHIQPWYEAGDARDPYVVVQTF